MILVEHSLSDGSVLHFVMKCQPGKDSFTELVKSNVPYLITSDDRIPVWMAFLINLINVFATFVWNFLDIFIMIVSIGLSTHFKYLNNELKQTKFEVVMEFNIFLMNEIIFIKSKKNKKTEWFFYTGYVSRVLDEHTSTIYEAL